MKSPTYLYKDSYFKLPYPSTSLLEDRTDKTHTPTNTNMNTPSLIEVAMMFITALNNIADALRGNASAPTNIVAGPGSTSSGAVATPSGAKPAASGGGNTAGLEKARAAAAAKRDAEKVAKEQAAQDELMLSGDGGGDAITLEMLRGKGMEILKAKKQPEMKALLEGLGAASITALTEDKYQEAYEGLEMILM